MTFKPLHDYVTVELDEVPEKSAGGIILPDGTKEQTVSGTVLALGPGKYSEQGKRLVPELKVGEKILLGKYAGSKIKVQGQEMLIIKEFEVLGLL